MIEYIAWFVVIGGLVASTLLALHTMLEYRRWKKKKKKQSAWEQCIQDNWQQFLDAAEEEVSKRTNDR